MNEDFKILVKVNGEMLFLSLSVLKIQVPSKTGLDGNGRWSCQMLPFPRAYEGSESK